jgi:hypothetical protein
MSESDLRNLEMRCEFLHPRFTLFLKSVDHTGAEVFFLKQKKG